MRELTVDELFFVSGGRQRSSQSSRDRSGSLYGDTSGNNYGESLGLPNSTLDSQPGWGSAIGSLIGGKIGGKNGTELGFVIGHGIENFDWEWYRKYRKIAGAYEQEYSGGLH